MASWYQLTSVHISPFCELARWTLDLAGLAYSESCHVPILNVPFTLRAGGGANVPVVQTPDAILDAPQLLEYIDARARPGSNLYPREGEARRDVEALVRSILDDLGIAVRLYAYANMLPDKRSTYPLMTSRAPAWERALVYLGYPIQAWLMRRALKITPAATEQARRSILSSFESLSARLRDGRPYLAGDRLTAADLVFASMTAPITLPPEYGAPLPRFEQLPPPMKETVLAVQATAAGRLALRLYRDHRRPAFDFQATSASVGETFSDRWRRGLQRFTASPSLLRPLFSVLRRFGPVWRFGSQAFVTRYADVVETVKRDQDFTIREINHERMVRISGPFILGMDRSDEYDREEAAIRGVVKPGDLETIRDIVRRTAQQLIEAAMPRRRLDATGSYARVSAARVVTQYFGVPGPSEGILMQWMRALFWDVFLNRDDQPLVRRAADASARELRDHLNALIAARTASPNGADDVLTRLVRAGALDADGVRRNITGIIVGAIDTTVTAASNALEVLLDNREALEQTRAAAQSGDSERLRQCCYEAMRFRPQTPAVVRHSPAGGTLSSGAKIPSGVTVLPFTLSAMFDSEAFPKPGRFLPDRPLDRYLHFGLGMHTCYGLAINGVQIPELIGALVRLPGLRRASGRFYSKLSEGPFPDRLAVEW
jgi:cytochrome P450/glutathione S-transferase